MSAERLANLEKFWSKVKDHFFDGYSDMDGADFQEWGIECGLLVGVPYEPKKHGDIEDTEPGDTIYVDPVKRGGRE